MRKSYLSKAKKLLLAGMVVSMMAMACACGSQKTATDTASTTEAVAEGDIVDSDFSNYAGTYTSEDGDTIEIGDDGSVEISMIRLCTMEGTASGVSKGIMPITVTDPAGEEMGLEFNVETKELIVVDSTWEYLENGDSFTMDK